MRADAFLARAEALPVADLDAVVGRGGLLVVAPHPDDESLGCGGLIAEACARGVDVRLAVVSDGTGSHPGSRTHPPARLRALREAETRAAADALGLAPEAITFLRLPDRAVPSEGPDAAAARDRLVALAAACAAGAVCVSWIHDPHCDHVAAARLVLGVRKRFGAARIFFYPIWGWSLPPEREVGPAPTGLRLDVSRHAAAKAAAVAAHRSQATALIDDDPDGFRLTPAMIERFARPFEILIEVPAEGEGESGKRETENQETKT